MIDIGTENKFVITNIVVTLWVTSLLITSSYAGPPSLDWKEHNINKIRLKVTNICAMGDDAAGRNCGAGRPFCEWPVGSYIDYFGGAGIWVGAIVNDTPIVDAGYQFTSEECYEFWPTDSLWDTIYVASILDTVSSYDIPFWPDYKPISEQDFVCQYQDEVVHHGGFWHTNLTHKPMHLKVVQRSYCWSYSYAEDFIYFDYFIINKGENVLEDVYLGYWLDANIGSYEIASWNWWMGDYSWRVFEDATDFYMIGMSDIPGGEDGTAEGPIGIRLIDVPKPFDSLKFSFHWYQYDEDVPTVDTAVGTLPGRYDILSDGHVDDDEPPDPSLGGGRCLMGLGPFESLLPGDTLKFTVAMVFGIGKEGVTENAKMAWWLYYDCGLRPPPPPPSPPLRVLPEDHKVTLNWKWEPGDPGTNPEEFVDSTRLDKQYQDFEGYRVYKSAQSAQGPWTLLAEYDIVDDYGYNTGLKYEYVDSGVVNGVPYWYAVTSYDKPDLKVPSLESATSHNVTMVYPGPTPPSTVGEVKVIPNPYLGDIDYTTGIRWEGPPEIWTEEKRRVQFVNLPAKCTIRIYTLAGELVKTIEHDDPIKGWEDWNLVSRVGQAIGSGIYVFSVRDHKTGKVQVGKFAVIK